MKIAAHHIKGTPEHRFSEMLRPDPEYTPACAWPDDCMVQWGHGIIPAVPFFEAFPPGTFIRGEGETIAEAERKAFAQYQSEALCNHVWGRHHERRGTYINGAAWCRKCGAFRGKMFREVVILGHWRKPLRASELDWLTSLETDDELNAHMDLKYPRDAARRRHNQRVLRLRLNLFGSIDPTHSSPPR
jgi:hypothetical protein